MKTKIIIFFLFQLQFINGFAQLSGSSYDIELKLIKGQYDSVIYCSKKLIEKDTTQADVYYFLGKAYQAKYKYFEALGVFEKAYKLDSSNRAFQNGLAETYETIGKDEDAIDIYYTQYLKDTLDIYPITSLANIFRKNKEFGSAIHYYQKAIAIDQTNFFYYKLIAYCFDQINLSMPAIMHYSMAIEINPYDLNVYMILANILNGERKFGAAISICKKGLSIDTLNVKLKKILAYTYYLNREFDLSIAGFNELISNNDSLFFNFKYRGLAYFENKDIDKSLLDLKEAFDLENKDPEVAFYLGSALGRTGEYNEAIKFMNMSISLLAPPQKEMSNIYSELSNIELSRENFTKSMDYLRLAYQSQPDPKYSFRMGQLYDLYLKDKKLAINYYDGFLTMVKERKSENGENALIDSTQIIYKNFAEQRIKILTEEMFFEGK